MSGATVSFVVAMDLDRAIGRDGTIPWRLPRDLENFRRLTMGKPVVMGRRTFESIGRLLPGRRNIVLSRRGFIAPARVAVVASVGEAMGVAAADGRTEVMVIGGSKVYRAFRDSCRTIHLTTVDGRFDGDAFFPFNPLDARNWEVVDTQDWPGRAGRPNATHRVLKRREWRRVSW